jgi:hypothetical protein
MISQRVKDALSDSECPIALHAALARVVDAAEEHIECEPGMYANECVGLGGADGLQTALRELQQALKECGV